MSDEEWALVRALLPVPGWLTGRGGRPEGYCHRQMIDAIRYLVDNGIEEGDALGLPALATGVLVAELHDRLRDAARVSEGRDQEPSAAILDSQSFKAGTIFALTLMGFDAGKKANGRKRHLLTDTLGRDC